MLGFGFGKHLPPFIKRPLDAAQLKARAIPPWIAVWRRRRGARRAYTGTRVAVLGVIGTNTGLGRGARLMVQKLQGEGVTAQSFDLTPLLDPKAPEDRRAVQDALSAFAPSDLIYHLNPLEFQRAIQLTPLPVLKSACVVAYWAWELERLPASWEGQSALCDEIWTCSEFVEQAVRVSLQRFPGAIQVKPHPTDVDPMPPVTAEHRARVRRALSLDETSFVIGGSFAAGSNFERKNPLASVAAFSAAFPRSDTQARLLLRCYDMHIHPAGETALRAAIADDDRIRILEEYVSIVDFYNALDVFISLHRSEGYGLNLVEAAQAGVAVVATGWSLGQDVLQRPRIHTVGSTLTPVADPQGAYNDVENARWANADIEAAAALLRHLRTTATQPLAAVTP